MAAPYRITASEPSSDDHIRRSHGLLVALQDGKDVPSNVVEMATAHALLASAIEARRANDAAVAAELDRDTWKV